MRDPDDPDRPLAMLPLRYLDEVKWISEERISVGKLMDKVSITQEAFVCLYLILPLLGTSQLY